MVILKRWLEHYYHDFEGELMQKFQEFINSNSIADSDLILLKKVFEVVQKKVIY